MSTKWYSLAVAATTATAAVACGAQAAKKTDDHKHHENDGHDHKKETKTTTTVSKGTVAKGTFKLGFQGNDFSVGGTKEIKDLVTLYTQNVSDGSQVGAKYLTLPSELFLTTDAEWQLETGGSGRTPEQTASAINTFWTTSILGAVQTNGQAVSAAKIIGNTTVYGGVSISGGTEATSAKIKIAMEAAALYDTDFKNKLWKLSDSNGYLTPKQLYDSLVATPFFREVSSVSNRPATASNSGTIIVVERFHASVSSLSTSPSTAQELLEQLNTHGQSTPAGKIAAFINFGTSNAKTPAISGNDIYTATPPKVPLTQEKTLSLKNYNLDTMFVSVKDGVHNSEKWYKSLVTDKEFKNTNILMVGDKSKSQHGSASKTFAGGKVSTASYNKYAAAYTAGFQAAVSQLAYSTDDKKFEETSVAFLVGSDSDSTSKKKAFAFYNGVKAAAAHPDYAAYLKVKFVSKSHDSSKSSKRLYRDITSWKTDNKISQFTGSDTFQDSERRVIYIAGATAQDWSGHSTDDVAGKWNDNDSLGLTGAIYKTSLTGTSGAKTVTGKTGSFSAGGIGVVLDSLDSGTTHDTSTIVNKINVDKDGGIDGDGDATDKFNRYDVKLLGVLGKEVVGTKVFAKAYLKALYLGGYNYMLGKHVIFGSQLQTSITADETTKGNETSLAKGTAFATTDDTSGNKVYAFKAYDETRWDTAVSNSFYKELTEATITATSPWMK